METKKFETGVVVGKFIPPHLGHIALIEKALERCHKLFIVVSDDVEKAKRICEEGNIPYLSADQRAKWLSEHFTRKTIASHIEVLVLDENGLEPFPSGASEIAKRLTALIPTRIDALFYGEKSRIKNSAKNFPNAEIIVIERGIDTEPNIEGKSIRKDWQKFKSFMVEGAIAFLNSFRLP